jgi:hypothetical protein
MFDYLEKYNKLPKEVRDRMSAPAVMSVVSELEKKYGLNLAVIIMKAMVGIIKPEAVEFFLIENERFDENKAKMLAGELREKIFSAAADYSGIKIEQSASQKIEAAIEKKEFARQPEAPSHGDKAAFSFSREDEKEVKDLKKKIEDYGMDAPIEKNLEEKIAEIFNKAKINFGSEALADRFKNILKIYIKGIRDKIETKQTLMKPIEAGGLGFDEDSARNILSIAGGDANGLAEKLITFNQPKRIAVPEDIVKDNKVSAAIHPNNLDELKKSGVRDVGYDFSSFKNKKENEIKLDTAHELMPPPPAVREAEEIKKQPDVPKEKRAEQPPIKTENITETKDNNFSARDLSEVPAREPSFRPAVIIEKDRQGKIKMEDIKYKPRVMGPIDELRYMDLINFRRLGLDSFQATAVIKNKINLFNEYKERQEGIAAWRRSPLNKLYLEMGGESISKNQPIDVIIEERKTAGKDYLKPPEFEAIIRLNKELRF